MYMRYREMAEKKGSGSAAAPKRIIFYRGQVPTSHRCLGLANVAHRWRF